MHKVISNHKLLNYFGISENTQHESALFFIYIQSKLSTIYDISAFKAFPSPLVLRNIRNKHISHLSTLLTGAIDNQSHNNAHQIWLFFKKSGVSYGEYVKFYQLIISYLTGEAQKKYWYRYKKYRKVSRAIRNLLMFDLAVSVSFYQLLDEPLYVEQNLRHLNEATIQNAPNQTEHFGIIATYPSFPTDLPKTQQLQLFEETALKQNLNAFIDSEIEKIDQKIDFITESYAPSTPIKKRAAKKRIKTNHLTQNKNSI